jgi:hypothetical protein
VECDARAACEQLIARYHRLIDVGAASEAAALFDADALLEVAGTGLRGTPQIAQALAARQSNTERRTLHALVGFDFEQADEDRAAASGALLVFAGNGAPIGRIPELLSRYQADFKRNDGSWQIAQLRVSIVDSTSELE